MNRHLFSLIAAAILAAPAVHAQSMEAMRHQHGDSAEHARMMAKLNLSADQKARIDAIHTKYAAQMKGAHDSTGMSGMTGMRAMHGSDSTMKGAMSEVRAVLNPAQQQKFDSMMTEHMKHREMHDGSAHKSMKQGGRSSPS